MKKLTLFFLLLATSAWALPTQKVNITGSAALNVLKAGDAMTGALSNSTAGAASTPAFTLTGAVFTGGTATTTKPLALIEPSGATSTAWSTNGTLLGVNSASGFTGNLIDAQINGTQRFAVTSGGQVFGTSFLVTATGINTSANNVTMNLGTARTYSTASSTQIKMLNGQSDTSSSGTGIGVAIQPTYNQTSTAGGTDLLINRTETAIGSGTHLLFDAQVGGSSKANINRLGAIYASQGGASAPSFWFTSHTSGKAGMGYDGAIGGILAYDTVAAVGWTATQFAPRVQTNVVATQNAGSPGIVFSNDFNTGIYSGGTDKIAFSANGTKRMEITTAGVTFDYGVQLTTGTKPTCDSSARGMFWHTAGGAGVKDAVEVCAKDAGDAYAWRTIY